MRTIYVLSLVTVAKINPPCFDKRWRYRVPPPRPFMSFCQCLSIINTDVCVEFYEILNILSASKSPEDILRFDTLPWQQYFRYQYSLDSFTSAVFWHYSDEVWSKLGKRCWIQSLLKMTHFLLPVGGAITLPHNCHIDAIGFIHRTNHWIVIKIRQCMWTLLDTSCLSILAITSSPRHGQTIRDIKNPSAI